MRIDLGMVDDPIAIRSREHLIQWPVKIQAIDAVVGHEELQQSLTRKTSQHRQLGQIQLGQQIQRLAGGTARISHPLRPPRQTAKLAAVRAGRSLAQRRDGDRR